MKRVLPFLLTAILVCACSSPLSTPEVSNEPETGIRSVVATEPIVTDKPSLCLVGDSRVLGWPTNYFTDTYDLCNLGVGGQISFETAYHMFYYLQHRYDAIIISVGINDYAREISLQNSVIHLDACIKQAKAKSDRVFITTIPGTTTTCLNPDFAGKCSYRAAQLNTFIPVLAANNGVEVINLHALLNTGFFINPIYDDGSGIHYNETAYQLIYDLYMTHLQEY